MTDDLVVLMDEVEVGLMIPRRPRTGSFCLRPALSGHRHPTLPVDAPQNVRPA